MELKEILNAEPELKTKIIAYSMFSDSVKERYSEGKLLKEIRTALGITQSEIAKRLKTSQSAISREENSPVLDPDYIQDYVTAMNFQISDFEFLKALFECISISSFKTLNMLEATEVNRRISGLIAANDEEATEEARTNLIEKVKRMSPGEIEDVERYYRMLRAEKYMQQHHLMSQLDPPEK